MSSGNGGEDLKLTRLIKNLSIKNFRHVSSYNKVAAYLKKLSPSTAEDYSWRLQRYLGNMPGFPEKLLKKYVDLNKNYKSVYVQK